jgi:hypothetical protein
MKRGKVRKQREKLLWLSGARQKDDLVFRLRASHLLDLIETPYDPRLPHLLAEISTEEAKAGRGMMTALVVRKKGDQRSGSSFFQLAERLGYDVSNPEKFWLEQVNKVFASWQKDGFTSEL